MTANLKRTAPEQTETISFRFAEFASRLRYEDLPDHVRLKMQLVLLDGIGCALVGAATPEMRQVRNAMREANGAGGDSALWGTIEKTSLPLAALGNGAAIHAREMDDFEGCLHSGAVILPATVGTASRVQANGRELITALVLGYDIARRTLEGGGGNLPFKDRGWHSTSVCGGFGAAIAAGRLLGLSQLQLQWALGFAGSTACGTWAFVSDGAMSKRVHPGFAAQAGVVAAYLAKNDVSSPGSIYEDDWGGIYNTFLGNDATPDRALDGLGEDFRLDLVGIKPHAACRGNHSAIDAALEFRRELKLAPEQVKYVRIRGNATHVRQLGNQTVTTPMSAQFSLPYSVAVALVSGTATIDQYTPRALQRADVQALTRRIEVVTDPDVAHAAQPFVEIHLTDGRVLTKRVLIPRGDRRNPLLDEEIRQKFRANAQQALSRSAVERIESQISDIANMRDVNELTELLVPSN
jgi:2-methylcitrate dehydratase PrpD